MYDTTAFTIGNKYRFCLVIIKTNDEQSRNLLVGCSNITKLKQIESNPVTDRNDNDDHFPMAVTIATTKLIKTIPTNSTIIERHALNRQSNEAISDISSFEKMTDLTQNARQPIHHDDDLSKDTDSSKESKFMTFGQTVVPNDSTTTTKPNPSVIQNAYVSQLLQHFNNSFMPCINVGILITSVFVLIWVATKITNHHHHRRTMPSTVCYAADQHSIDIENGNRYLKLQATTTL